MSRVYLDSNIFIYYFDNHPTLGAADRSLFARVQRLGHQPAAIFSLSEILVRPTLTRDEFKIASVNRFFRSSAVMLVPYPLEAVPIYAALRAHHRVRPLDALHLAGAAHADGDLFPTNDLSLAQLTVPGIGAIAGLDTAF